jgi:hypothetical protein
MEICCRLLQGSLAKILNSRRDRDGLDQRRILLIFVCVGILYICPRSAACSESPSLHTPEHFENQRFSFDLAQKERNTGSPDSLNAQIQKLIASKWQQVIDQGAFHAPDITTWEFYDNGNFRRRFTADYAESSVGAWSLSATPHNRGILFLMSARRHSEDPLKYQVLPLEFAADGLFLGGVWYTATPYSGVEDPPLVGQETKVSVEPAQRTKLFSLWATLTTSDWKSEAAPPPGDPDMYSFSTSGECTIRFTPTHCEYSGLWSLTVSEEHHGKLRVSVPANTCDPRGPTNAFVREIPLELKNTTLWMYKSPYIPLPRKPSQ